MGLIQTSAALICSIVGQRWKRDSLNSPDLPKLGLYVAALTHLPPPGAKFSFKLSLRWIGVVLK